MSTNSGELQTNQYNTVLYTGVTNDLARRVWQHRHGQSGAFTRKYRVTKLVYCEPYENISQAIAREKQIKGGSRKRKGLLVESLNPDWLDLAEQLHISS